MGFFGKIKENFNHGGVRVQLQAPSSVTGNEIIAVSVVLSADSPQTVNSVKVQIKVQQREQGMNVSMGNSDSFGSSNQQTAQQVIAEVESRESFTLAAGETKTVQLQLALNGNAGRGNDPFAGIGGTLGSVLQAATSIAQNFDNVSYIYSLHATADVAGIAMDPGDHQPLQVLPPTAEPTAQLPTTSLAPQPSALVQPQPTPITPAEPSSLQPPTDGQP